MVFVQNNFVATPQFIVVVQKLKKEA